MASVHRLVAILRERSVRVGAFTLSSGATSDLYVDARQTTLNAEGAALVAELVLARLRPEVVGVGGMTLGADPIACAASAWSIAKLGRPVHAFLIRKEAKAHGAGQRVEGLASLPRGSRVCVVEDTTTTGKSLLAAVDAAREAGLDVVQCVTVVDRLEGAAEAVRAAGLTLEALTTRAELIA
ncbi:MAG: orotate phosphoribosyltransferase [Myxococcota bacterium]